MGRITLWGFYKWSGETLFDNIMLPHQIIKTQLIHRIMRRSGMLFPYHQDGDELREGILEFFDTNLDRYKRMAEVLSREYNPIENYDRTEERTRDWNEKGSDSSNDTGSDESTDTGNSTRDQVGNSMETNSSKSEGHRDDSTAETGQNRMTRSGQETLNVSAYNAQGFQPREERPTSGNQTDDTTRDAHTSAEYADSGSGESSVNSKVTDTSDTYGRHTGNRSGEHSGQYGKDGEETESVRAHGNIGVTSTQQMITQEMELRIQYNLYEIICREFEAELLVQVY